MRTYLTCCLLLLVSCGDYVPQPEPLSRQIIIFHDISESLSSDQTAAGAAIVDQIIDNAPVDTELVVIPVCENTADAPAVRWRVEAAGGISALAEEDAKSERAKHKREIDNQAAEIRQKTRAASSRYSSCISPALRRAAHETVNAPGGTDVIFVSDMIEECRDSVLGQPVQLTLADGGFMRAQTLLGKPHETPAAPRAMRVYVMRPQSIRTAAANPDHPRGEQLEAFWKHLFRRCGVAPDRIRWDANPSQYLHELLEGG